MHSPNLHLRAICLAIAGFTCWVLCDSTIKLASKYALPNYEIIAFLGLFMVMFIGIYAAARGEVRQLWPNSPSRVLIRSSADVVNNLFVVIALRHLTLTLFYILVFTSPLLVVILERIFLKERLEWRRAVAIAGGFLGVVVAVYPSRAEGRAEWTGFAAAAICVVSFSGGSVLSRHLTRSESPQSMPFFSGPLSAIVGLLLVLHGATPVNARLLLVLVLMGILCAAGSICNFLALKYATAATVSQYHYTRLLSGSLAAYLLFHEKPTIWMLAGAVLIVTAGIYVAMRQKPQSD